LLLSFRKEARRGVEKERVFFFEKKKQKTFTYGIRGLLRGCVFFQTFSNWAWSTLV